MRFSKTHSLKGFFLLLLTMTIFLSSAGMYYASAKTEKHISKKVSAEKETKEERVTASPNFEAVVVSLIHHDFSKEFVFSSFEFSLLLKEVVLPPQRSIFEGKYFRTLFTHFISPNAP